jgi:hypothetical protein
MKYILILPTGRIMAFYIQGLAQSYQRAYGGVLIQEDLVARAQQTVDKSEA